MRAPLKLRKKIVLTGIKITNKLIKASINYKGIYLNKIFQFN